jgi:PAS domain S-box-containing protein
VILLAGAISIALLVGAGAGWWLLRRHVGARLEQEQWQAARLRQIHKQLRESEERYELAVAGLDAGIFDWDLETDRAWLSPRTQGLFGLIPGEPWRPRREWLATIPFHADDVDRLRAEIRSHLAGQSSIYDVEYRARLPDGAWRWYRQRGRVVRDAVGKPCRMVGSVENIDERKKAEDELRRRRRELQRLTESISDYLWSAEVASDGAIAFRYFSPVVERITGRPREHYLGEDASRWLETIDPHDRAAVTQALRDIVAGGAERLDVEYRIRRADDATRWLRDSIHATRLDDGRVLLDGVVSDVTERRLADEALRESESRFRSLTELSSDWYWRQDEDLRFNYLSSQAADLTGYPGESSYGKARWELLNLRPLSGAWGAHRAVLDARLPFRDLELARTGPDGTVRYLSITGAPLFDDEGRFTGYHGVGRNITEHRRIEEELRARQDMLDLAQEAARAAAFEWRLGPGDGATRWTPALEAMLGLPPGGYDGSIERWKDQVFVADRTSALEALRRPSDNGDVSLEYRVAHPDGRLRWLQLQGRISFDAGGVPIRLVGIMQDVTQRHQAEEDLRRLERQLRQAQRLEAMGTLAGGIAHDFNNILGAILGYGEMALRDAPKGSRLQRDLDSIMTAGERGRALVEQILAFSRNSGNERIAVHVERVVREALDHVAATLPRGIDLVPVLRTGRAGIRGDPTQVHQVVMNLVTNAWQAMPGGGRLSVLLDPVRLEERCVATTGTIAAGDYVVLEVADSGTGMSAQIVERIFDPFFTTKEVGMGTGLGLSLVHGIVGELGGSINVASEPGAGSRFTVYLPRGEDVEEVAVDEEPDAPQGNGERVLVVDDDEPLMLIAAETLEDYGYEARGFTSSLAALEAFRTDPHAFDAVVTDERMPGLSGIALIREMRGLHAGLPAILMSGFIAPSAPGAPREAVPDEILRKPLSGRDLAASLARVLQKDAATLRD